MRDAELVEFEPDFTIINACSVVNPKWQEHGLNSEVAVAFNIEKRLAVIFGTWCDGRSTTHAAKGQHAMQKLQQASQASRETSTAKPSLLGTCKSSNARTHAHA
jgi:ATP-dependent phosphoenolpyruvate carboxykinase